MIRSRGGLTSYVGYGALTLILMYILFLYNATKNGLSQCELTGIQLKEDKQDLLSQLSVCHEHSKRLRTSSDETSDALSKCSTARRETEKSQQRCVEDFRAKKEELNTKELEFSKSERDASILRSKLAIKEEDCSRVEQKSLAEYQQCKDQKQEMETDLQGQLAVKNSKIETLTQDLANLQQQIQQLQQQQQQVQQQAQQQQQLQQQPLQQQPAVAFLPALRQQSANGAANPMPGHQPFVPQFQQADTLGKILNPPVNNNGNAPPLQPLALLQQVAALQPAVENQNLPVAANQNLPVAANQNLPVAANQNLPAAANQNEVVGAAQPGALPQVAQEVKGQQDSNNGQPAGVGPTGVGPDGVGPVENKRGVVAFSETSKPAVNSIIKRSLEKQVEARRALRRPGGGGDYRLQVKGADDKQPANEEKELHDNNHVPDRYQVDKVGLGRDEVNKDTMDKPPQQPLPLHPFPGDEDNHENTAGNIMKADGNEGDEGEDDYGNKK